MGSFTINGGNENTITATVTLSNSITGAMEMRFGNTPGEVNDAPWEFYATTKVWTLSTGLAIKTVMGQFRDLVGNIYETEDTIRLIKKITPGDGAMYDCFGYSVAISADGSTMVVGAYSDDDNGDASGSVYIIPLE